MADKKDNFFVDIITGIFFLFFCTFFYFENKKLNADAGLFPGMIIWALVLCSIILIGTSVYKKKLSRKKGGITENKKQTKSLCRREILKYEFFTIIFFILVITFIILLPIIGFELAAFIFMLTGMWWIDKEQLKRNYYIPVLIPAILTLIFRVIFNLSLPVSTVFTNIFNY